MLRSEDFNGTFPAVALNDATSIFNSNATSTATASHILGQTLFISLPEWLTRLSHALSPKTANPEVATQLLRLTSPRKAAPLEMVAVATTVTTSAP